MKNLKCAISVIGMICLFMFLPSSGKTDVIRFVAEGWCPYDCNPEKEEGRKGYIPDIAITVFSKAGYKVIYRIMPYLRAIKETRDGRSDGIIGIYREDAPDMIFPEEEQGRSINAFFVKKNNGWRYSGPESLKSLEKIGIVRGYDYGEEVTGFFSSNPDKVNVVFEDDPLAKIFQMMMKGRHEAGVDDIFVGRYSLRKMGLSDQIIEAGIVGESHPVYIGFSPANKKSGKYARILVDGVRELRKSGKLEDILKEYGLKDWINNKK